MTFKADYSALFFLFFSKKTLDIFFKMCYTIIVPRGRVPKTFELWRETDVNPASTK